MLPISRETLLSEFKTVITIMEAWENKLRTEGFPEIDNPETGTSLESFLRNMCGELQLCSAKCQAISEIFMGFFQ